MAEDKIIVVNTAEEPEKPNLIRQMIIYLALIVASSIASIVISRHLYDKSIENQRDELQMDAGIALDLSDSLQIQITSINAKREFTLEQIEGLKCKIDSIQELLTTSDDGGNSLSIDSAILILGGK